MPLFVLGSNCMGQLGLPDTISSTNVPINHEFFKEKQIKKICAGKLHALALCNENQLFSWGVNDDCALGREGNQNLPELVSFKYEIMEIVAGASFSAILTTSGTVYACGTFKSSSGIFGFDKKNTFQKKFKKIENLRKITRIYAGHNHLIAIDRENNLWTFGANEALQLGRRNRERNIKRCLDAYQVSAKKRNSQINTFITAAGGGCYSHAINIANQCFGWGGNYNGQLGNGTTIGSEHRRPASIENVVDVACGSSHSLFLNKNKELYGCGDNTLSQLGIKGEKMYKTPVFVIGQVDKVRAGCDFSIAQRENKLFGWGSNMNGEIGFDEIQFDEIFTPTEIQFEFTEILDFQCGTDFTMILTK